MRKKAAISFKESSFEERSLLLKKIADHLEQNAESISYEEALYQGLPQSFVLENSVRVSIQILRHVAESLSNPLPSNTLVQPNGVVGIITSWVCSLRLIVERMAPALAAGNTVVIKVSEQSPITAKILGEALQQVQAPSGVVTLLQGSADIGQIIAGHPSIQAITAVGKTSTMESIAKAGLTQFKNCN